MATKNLKRAAHDYHKITSPHGRLDAAQIWEQKSKKNKKG